MVITPRLAHCLNHSATEHLKEYNQTKWETYLVYGLCHIALCEFLRYEVTNLLWCNKVTAEED